MQVSQVPQVQIGDDTIEFHFGQLVQNVLLLETRAHREYMGERKVNEKAKSTQEMSATCELYLKSAESKLRLRSTIRMHLSRVAHWCRWYGRDPSDECVCPQSLGYAHRALCTNIHGQCLCTGPYPGALDDTQ